MLIQYMRVVQDSRHKEGVFDDILYHFSCHLVEDNVSRLQANAFCQTKMFLRARKN
jgi:hypothetical protein